MADLTLHVLSQVAAERARQDARWGEQNHPDGTGDQHVADGGELRHEEALLVIRQERATQAKEACDRAAREGRMTYRHILEEEVAEARAEGDREKLRAELVQVAAVAVAWVEKLDREAARG